MSVNGINLKTKSIWVVFILITSGILTIFPLNPTISGVKGESLWVQTTDKDFYNGTFDNISISDEGEEAELKIDLSDIQMWTEKTHGNRPICGLYHEMAAVWGTDKVVLFGGYWYYGGTYYQNETWVYDLSDDIWTKMHPITTPSARIYHSMSSIDGDDKILLFGGQYGSYLNDTWVYDLSDNEWIPQNPIGELPPARSYHGMVSIGGYDKVMLFGGYYSSYYNDTWVYDLSENIWIKMMPSNNPIGTYLHSMVSIDGTDKILLFGGYYYYYDNTWIYDYSDNTWTRMFPATRPTGRYYHSMATVYGTDEVILFGGYINYPYQYTNDTWIYDLSANTWTKKYSKIKPPAGWYQAMAGVYGTDKVVLFGGYNPYINYWDQTWIYEHNLPTKNGTYISKAYDTGDNSSFKKLSWYAIQPENTTVRFQLRTSPSEQGLNLQDFVGPDGTALTYYYTTPAEIWSGHNGDRWIQYKLYLNMSTYIDTLSLREVTITYNCLPNTIVIGPIDGILLSNNKPIFVWCFEDIDSEEQKAFQVLIDDEINFESIDYDSGEQRIPDNRWMFPSGTSYNDIPDGTWYWKVRTKDEDNVWTEYSKNWSFTIDTQAPGSSPTIPANNAFYNDLKEIRGMATDPNPGSGITKIEIKIQRVRDNLYWNGIKWVPLVTWLEVDGTESWIYDAKDVKWTSGHEYSIQSRAVDQALNLEDASTENKFLFDKERPFSIIDYPINNSWLNEVDSISGYSFDIGNSGINKIEVSIKRPLDNKYWYYDGWDLKEYWITASGTEQWSFNTSTVKWKTGVKYVIRSRATDNSDNTEYPYKSVSFNFDNKPPTNLSININNGDEYSISTYVDLACYAEDSDSGVVDMSFNQLGVGGMEWTPWMTYDTQTTLQLTLGDGEKIIHFRVRDLAGNIAESVFDNIILDTNPPKDLSILINNNDRYTNSKKVTLTLTAVDSLAGLNEMSFSLNGVSWYAWEPFQLTRWITIPKPDGEIRIHFRVSDKAGNIADPVSDTIILDTTPPQMKSAVINNGAFETNSTLVTVKLSAVDHLSGLNQISFSADGQFWSSWEEYSDSKLYTLPEGYGLKTVYFKVKDNAGNVAEPISASILLNTTSSPEKESQPSKKSSSTYEIWYILIIIILILLFILLIGIISKRMKRIEQQLIRAEQLSFKPSAALATPLGVQGQITGAPTLLQLPSSTAGGAAQAGGASADTPLLAKSIDIKVEGTTVSSGPTSELPQLPPARIQDLEPKPESATPTTTEETTQLIPKLATTVKPTDSPEVHLPEAGAPKQPTQEIEETGTPTPQPKIAKESQE